MTESILEREALTTLDWALRQTDPITRMMLIEQALKLHRRAVEGQEDDSDGEPQPSRDDTRPHRH